jgi:hypothetical protein
MKRKQTKQGGKFYFTREIARAVAKANCKNAGMVRICKKTNRSGKKRDSWFSHYWREWAFSHLKKADVKSSMAV